tara:strand:- start:216 stop:446 length:231 start_codon:yes stop_codon:yes gene_type:complete
MVNVTNMFEESFEYIRYPEYAMPSIIFCVGAGLSTFSISKWQSMNDFQIWQPFLMAGGLGLTVWSITQFYVLYLNR